MKKTQEQGTRIPLPKPVKTGSAPLEQCLATRRSCRAYGDAPLTLQQAAQLLWSAQGVTGLGGLRTAPSARAIYPLRTYLIAQQVEGLAAGVYRYDPDEHELEVWSTGDYRKRMVRICFEQEWIYDAQGIIMLAADFSSMIREFGDRAQKLTFFECGHVAGNACLQATALGLGAITVAAFDPAALAKMAALPIGQEPQYLVPVGEKM